MCHPAKLSLLLVVLLIVTLVACTPVVTPATLTLTNPPRPTETPVPTATLPPEPTSTPRPINGKFDAGGVKLYLICYGEGNPTVVLDAGWGMGWTTWSGVMREIRPHTRICAYDRASMGHSDKQTGQRTSQQIAEQLHTLLANAGVKGPYIPVGHSLGGMNMLVFADRYRDEVVGLVLVDSAHPDSAERELAILPTPSPNEDEQITQVRKYLTLSNSEDPNFPEPMNWDETLAQVRAVKTLGSLPLIVLVQSPTSVVNLRELKANGAPDDLAPRLAQVWLGLHKEQAALSSNSQLIQAEHSGHFIQNDEPQLVIDAILNLVDKARQK